MLLWSEMKRIEAAIKALLRDFHFAGTGFKACPPVPFQNHNVPLKYCLSTFWRVKAKPDRLAIKLTWSIDSKVAYKTGFTFTAKEFYCATFIGYYHVTKVADTITW